MKKFSLSRDIETFTIDWYNPELQRMELKGPFFIDMSLNSNGMLTIIASSLGISKPHIMKNKELIEIIKKELSAYESFS